MLSSGLACVCETRPPNQKTQWRCRCDQASSGTRDQHARTAAARYAAAFAFFDRVLRAGEASLAALSSAAEAVRFCDAPVVAAPPAHARAACHVYSKNAVCCSSLSRRR